MYAIMFPIEQYPSVWSSIREARTFYFEYNPLQYSDSFFTMWDPMPEKSFESTYLSDTVAAKELKKRTSPKDKSKQTDQNSMNKTIMNLMKDEIKKSKTRSSNMQSIGGILKECRNGGRAMATQPKGFVAGTVMRDYQKMSLSFLLDLEHGKNTGMYEFVKLATCGTLLQYVVVAVVISFFFLLFYFFHVKWTEPYPTRSCHSIVSY